MFRFLAFPRDLAYSECKIIRARNRFLESKVDLKISRPRTNFRSLKFFPSLQGEENERYCIPWSKGGRPDLRARISSRDSYSPALYCPIFLEFTGARQILKIEGSVDIAPLPFLYREAGLCRFRFIVPFSPSSCLDFSPPVSSSFFVVPSLLDNNTPCRILNRGSVYRDTREREREKMV